MEKCYRGKWFCFLILSCSTEQVAPNRQVELLQLTAPAIHTSPGLSCSSKVGFSSARPLLCTVSCQQHPAFSPSILHLCFVMACLWQDTYLETAFPSTLEGGFPASSTTATSVPCSESRLCSPNEICISAPGKVGRGDSRLYYFSPEGSGCSSSYSLKNSLDFFLANFF